MSNARPRSVSVVALLADIPTTGQLGDAQARRFPLDGPDLATQADAFLDFAGGHLAAGRKVVALYPKWRAERARRAIRFARGSFRTDHIAAVEVDLSPLAFSLMADQLAYLAPYLPSGLIAALADELQRHILAGAWLKNVGNLSTIPITVGQHMGSYAPKVTFLAVSAPIQQVGRVRRGDPTPNIPFRPVDPVQMLVSAGGGADTESFDSRFLPALQPVSAQKLPEQPLGAEYWGSSKYIEFVAFSAHQDSLTRPAHAVRPTACAWCREPVTAAQCPFCRAVNQRPAGRPPSYSRAAQVPAPTRPAPARPGTSAPMDGLPGRPASSLLPAGGETAGDGRVDHGNVDPHLHAPSQPVRH
ncbi:hypothetical protein ACQEU5_14840 [Marinactinospora thermotolerans]|uniref:hypothetical protein n=1 Tax=Marinactinospora thermotolerans TaxID=531310 RepID=UPI003D89D8B3